MDLELATQPCDIGGNSIKDLCSISDGCEESNPTLGTLRVLLMATELATELPKVDLYNCQPDQYSAIHDHL